MKLIAKLMAAVMILTVVPVQAEPLNVVLKWKDGYTYTYYNMPSETPVEALAARLQKDFPDRNIQDLVQADTVSTKTNIHTSVQAVNAQQPASEPKEEEWSTTKKIVVGVIVVAAIAWAWNHFDMGSRSGPCDSYNDRAADGSLCGMRAASMRPGGR